MKIFGVTIFGGAKTAPPASNSNSKGDGSHRSSDAARSAEDEALRKQKAQFDAYLAQVMQVQRDSIADRIEKMQNVHKFVPAYFVVGQAAMWCGAAALFRFRASRNLLRNSLAIRDIAMVTGMCGLCLGACIYGIRITTMKVRFSQLIKDYNYELRRIQAHHTPQGVLHIAYLEFLLEQSQFFRETHLDINAIRQPAKRMRLKREFEQEYQSKEA